MAEAPLLNAEGLRLLCAVTLKKSDFKRPSIAPRQVRAAWPELARHDAGLELIVLPPDGEGNSHHLTAHVIINEDRRSKEMRKSFFLSGTGERCRRCRCC